METLMRHLYYGISSDDAWTACCECAPATKNHSEELGTKLFYWRGWEFRKPNAFISFVDHLVYNKSQCGRKYFLKYQKANEVTVWDQGIS